MYLVNFAAAIFAMYAVKLAVEAKNQPLWERLVLGFTNGGLSVLNLLVGFEGLKK